MLKALGKFVVQIIATFVALAVMVTGCFYVTMQGMGVAVEEMKKNPDAYRFDPTGEENKKKFSESVAADLIDQYNMVEDDLEKSIRAGAVAEAFLQAKNQEQYKKWKQRSDQHRQRAIGN